MAQESDQIICARLGCEEAFSKKTHNQKYHNDECCRIATNDKIKENYYEKKAQRQGLVRMCRSCHTTKLSRYNDGKTCSSCQSKRQEDLNSSVLAMLTSATA